MKNVLPQDATMLYEIKKMNIKCFLENKDCTNFLYKNLKDIYINAQLMMNRIMTINDFVFVLYNEVGNIMGMSFYSIEPMGEIKYKNKNIKCIYNGFVLIGKPYRLQNLFLKLQNYAMANFETIYNTYLCFALTATPIAMKCYYKNINNVKPNWENLLSTIDIGIVMQLHKKIQVNAKNENYPFVVQSKLLQRYNENYKNELKEMNLKEKDFLHQLNVVEENGDRVLLYFTNNNEL